MSIKIVEKYWMENVILWGIGKTGKDNWTTKLIETCFNIKGYCDNKIKEKVFNDLPILFPNELQEFCEKEKVYTFIITVRDPKAVLQIKDQIKNLLIQIEKLNIVSFIEIKDKLEKLYVQKMVQKQGKWNVNTKNQFNIWLDNIMDEVKFWINSVAKENGMYHYDYLRRIKNHMLGSFDEDIIIFEKQMYENARIMDIGCGLAPKYGNRTRFGCNLRIDRVDPLAYFYNKVNEKFALNAEVNLECKYGMFEFIANFYDKETFDGIIICNALDHCFNPFKALIELLYVMKTGGYIYTNHHHAEAVYESYHGLHKFNIDYTKNDDLVIWNEENFINVTEALKSIAEIKVIHTNCDVKRADAKVITLIKKNRNFALNEFINMVDEQQELANMSACIFKFLLERDIYTKFKEELN